MTVRLTIALSLALTACTGSSPPAATAPAGPTAAAKKPLTAADAPRLYTLYRCINCHGPDGKGQGGMFNLTANRQHYPTDEALAAYIKDPRSRDAASQMPPYGSLLKEDELGILVAYVRTMSPAEPSGSGAGPSGSGAPATP